MPKITFASKAQADVAKALAPYADRLYHDESTELTIVATITGSEWKKALKTSDEEDYAELTVKVTLLDAEVVTGPHEEAAAKAFEAARTERETAGTLLEGAFDDQL